MTAVDLTEAVRQAADAALLAGAVGSVPSLNGITAAVAMVYGEWAQDAADSVALKRCRQPCPVAATNLGTVASAVATEANRLMSGLVAAHTLALARLAEVRGVTLREAATELLGLSEERP